MSYITANNSDKKNEKLICPNAPRITIKPEKKKIPYINVIENDDSFSSEEKEEKDDDESFDSNSSDKDTKSESGNVKN